VNSPPFVDHAIAQRPDLRNLDLEHIAGLHPQRRIAAMADAFGRAGRDDIAWREGGDTQRLSIANDAFRRIAEMRGNEALWKKWEQAKDGGMTPERAYSTLEVPAEIDDGMLITIFSLRVRLLFPI